MKVSKEIAEKVERYKNLQNEANKLYKELAEYFTEECGAEGFGEPFITDTPTGQSQLTANIAIKLPLEKIGIVGYTITR